jgi:hypothetical protein
MRLPWLAGLVLGLGAAGCGWFLEPEARCLGPGWFSRCAQDGQTRIDCLDGQTVLQACEAGTRCLEYWTPAGVPSAACALPDATLCQPETYRSVCRDPGGRWLCDGGYTRHGVCSGDTSCVDTPVGADCLPPGVEVCDPADFVPECRGDQPAFCGAFDGLVRLGAACQAPAECRVGPRGPVCVQADAQACDPAAYRKVCLDERSVLGCSFSTHFTALRACPEGERCRESSSSAACFGPEQPDCDPASFRVTCEGADRRTCSAYGVEQASACPADRPCREGGVGGWCAEPGAVACDPAVVEPACEGTNLLLCNWTTGFFYRQACEAGLVCAPTPDPWAWYGLVCLDPASPACETPGAWGCEGDRVVFCAGGLEHETVCEPGSVCVADAEMWLCLPDSYPVCDAATFEDGCQENEVHVCFGDPGREIIWPCGDAATCVIVPDQGPTCQPI